MDRFFNDANQSRTLILQIYLSAISGIVPSDIVKSLAAFLDFCYIARRNSLDTQAIADLEAALQRFHRHRHVFIRTGVRDSISLPRQHSLMHYARSIRLFGAPNGLCSSITESKHIEAVKEPWRRSNRFEALSQMIVTNQRLNKMKSARARFTARGMMAGTSVSYTVFERSGGIPVPPPLRSDEDEDNEGNNLGGRRSRSVQLAATAGACDPLINSARHADVASRAWLSYWP
jgi:hypothetical protein